MQEGLFPESHMPKLKQSLSGPRPNLIFHRAPHHDSSASPSHLASLEP